MELRRIYSHDNSLNEELRVAIGLASSLEDFAPWERVVEVMKSIPNSPNYFIYPLNTEYGYEVHILVPQE